MTAPRDVLDEMLADMSRRQVTAVLGDHDCRLDDLSRDALEFIGWQTLLRERALVSRYAMPRIAELIRAGKEFRSGRWLEEDTLPKEEREQLAVIGLLALSGARQAKPRKPLNPR